MTENFPNLGSDLDIQIYEVTRFPNSTQRLFSKTHYDKIVNMKAKRELKAVKEACNLQGNHCMAMSRFLSRNLTI